jgi:hypothetical protein
MVHFAVTDIHGRSVRYDAIWQRRALVLVCLPQDGSSEPPDDIARLLSGVEAFADDTTCVVTRDPVARVNAPAVVVADQWGEVAHVSTAMTVDGLPSANDVLTWVHHLRLRCPECEGEAR